MECLCLTDLSLDTPIRPRPPGATVPLIALQRLLWDGLVRQGAPLNTRVCAISTRIQGSLDLVALERSIEAVRHRHESLRTRVVIAGGAPVQHVDPPEEYRLETIDLSNQSLADALMIANRSAQELLDEKIDISVGPMFASKVWKLQDGDYVFVTALDHMISDGASYTNLSREIWTLYSQYAEGVPAELPALQVQFPDYAVWQQRTLTDWKRRHEPYWRCHMSGVQRMQYPWGGESKAAPSALEARHIWLGHSISAQLRALANREGVDLHLLVLSIYAIVMACWCGRDDLIIRYISHGRQHHPELKNMIGFIVNWVPLRIRVEEYSFRELLARLKCELADALNHQDYNRLPCLIPECQTELEFHWQENNRMVRSKARAAGAGLPFTMRPFNLRVPNWCPRFWPVFFDTPVGISITLHFQPAIVAPSLVDKFGDNLRLIASEYLARSPDPVRSAWMKIK